MKNINEQIERIKQLFTEERLHGNLVENDNVALLTEQEKQKKKYNRGVERAKRKLERKLKKSKSKEEMDKAQEKFDQKTSELWTDYSKNPKSFNTKKLLFKKGDLKLYGHKDKSSELMLVSLGKGVGAEEGSKGATELIKLYFKEKFAKDNEDIEVTLMTNDKFKSGKEYVVFSVIDNSDLIPSQEDKSTDGPTEKPTGKPEGGEEEKEVAGAKTDAETKAEPEAKADAETKAEPEAKADAETKTVTPKTGDFTKPLQRLGGSQKGYTYHLVGPKKAEKRDANGKLVATYIKESTFNKKSLFESAYTFDMSNTLMENWKWVEGDKTFSDSLSKKFDDAIVQIGDAGSQGDKNNQEVAGAKVGVSSTAAYNCIDYDAGGEHTELGGTKAFLIKNDAGEEIYFFADGNLRYKKIADGKFTTLTGDYDCNEDTFSLSNGEKGKLKEALKKFEDYKGESGETEGSEEKPQDTSNISWDDYQNDEKNAAVVKEIQADLKDDLFSSALVDLADVASSTDADELGTLLKIVTKYEKKKLLHILNQAYKFEVSSYGNTFYEDIKDVDCVMGTCIERRDAIAKKFESQGVNA